MARMVNASIQKAESQGRKPLASLANTDAAELRRLELQNARLMQRPLRTSTSNKSPHALSNRTPLQKHTDALAMDRLNGYVSRNEDNRLALECARPRARLPYWKQALNSSKPTAAEPDDEEESFIRSEDQHRGFQHLGSTDPHRQTYYV